MEEQQLFVSLFPHGKGNGLFNHDEINNLFLNPERYYMKLLFERWEIVMKHEELSRIIPEGRHIPTLYLEILKKLVPYGSSNKDMVKDFFALEAFVFSLNFPVDKRDELRQRFRLLIIEYTNKREHELFQKIYADLSIERMKKLALILTPGEDPSASNEQHPAGPNSMTYGEIEFNSFLYILEWCKKEITEKKFLPSSGLSFTDLGHGTGKAMVIVDSVFPSLFQRINGIELSYGLYAESIQRLHLYQEMMNPSSDLLPKDDQDFLQFHHAHTEFHTFFGDFLQKNFQENNHPVSFDWTQSGMYHLVLYSLLLFPFVY